MYFLEKERKKKKKKRTKVVLSRIPFASAKGADFWGVVFFPLNGGLPHTYEGFRPTLTRYSLVGSTYEGEGLVGCLAAVDSTGPTGGGIVVVLVGGGAEKDEGPCTSGEDAVEKKEVEPDAVASPPLLSLPPIPPPLITVTPKRILVGCTPYSPPFSHAVVLAGRPAAVDILAVVVGMCGVGSPFLMMRVGWRWCCGGCCWCLLG